MKRQQSITKQKPSRKSVKLRFKSDGSMVFIYDDNLNFLMEDMDGIDIQRVSHVEPKGNQWFADMTPVKGPCLGPFTTRRLALEAEVKWLEENRI